MTKIAVIGDTESIKGFAAVGLDIYSCDNPEDAAAVYGKIISSDYGVIYITEQLVPFFEREIAKADKLLTPSVVPIPGVIGNNGCGTAFLKAAVEKAVGSDIIFNK